ncbi:DNA/RNA non-specific endonuclease (plasmid) [Streptomyces clavifer]|uniref:DNA/RNA non-specific endonuclease n=1 Tax=Streptomyces clavifer TaxID=68188 RepID=UPI002E7FCFFE|nr:DNA/RNA non-specific endonuclease [Streptomyces clavifer]WUC32357.1 DNA/RNA non-specific endonuclease [Streptomyces clavifer]
MTRTSVRGRARSRTGRTPTVLRRVGVVLAGALTAGILSAFPALADEPTTAAGTPVPLGSVTATADDQLFALAADHTAVYRYSGQGTDWTKVGGPAETLHAGGAGLFATSPDTGKVFKYDGTPEAWSQIGEAGADFAVTGDRLYALNPDRTAVYEWSGQGTQWAKVGGPAKDLDAGGAGLFATAPDDKIFKYDGAPEAWTQIGDPGADFAVTGDRLYGIAADRSAVYEWSGQGTKWAKVGGPAQDLHAGGAGLFATDRTTGQLNKYTGQPDSWTQTGEPGAAFTVSDTHLYGLAPGGTAVLQWAGTGTDWTPLGAPTTTPTPAPPAPPAQETPPPTPPAPAQPQESTPVAPEAQESVPAPPPAEAPEAAEAPAVPGSEGEPPPEGESGQRETVPAPALPAGASDTLNEHTVRIAVTAQDDLYTLAADNSGLWKRGSDGWTSHSGPANAVHAGRAGVFMNGPDSEQIRKYDADTRAWEPISGSAGQFAVTGKHLYRLTPDGIGEWHGDTWTKIGGPAKTIYAGRAGLFATNPDTGDLYKYDGKPHKWTRIGGPGAQFAVGHDHVYGITPDHKAVYEWSGKGTDWTRIGGAAKELYAGGAGLFATNPDTGNIHKYNGTPGSWTQIGGPGATFAVSDTQLYGLSPDLTTTYRWNNTTNTTADAGTGGDWTRLGGAADIAQQQKDEQLLAANCAPGRDCVKEYRDAKKTLETSLTDWLKDNSLDILLDTFGIDNIVKCSKGDPGKCLWAAVDVGGSILGVGLLKKGGKLSKALYRFSKDYPKFIEKTKQAKDAYDTLRTTIDTARNIVVQKRELLDRNAKDLADDFKATKPDRADCRRNGAGWLDLGTRDAAHGYRATAMNACLDTAYLTTHAKRGSPTTSVVRPPGYQWATSTAGYLRIKDIPLRINNCHLLGKQLTGSGEDLDNLVTCSRAANAQVTGDDGFANDMAALEGRVKTAVDGGQVVRYQVTPVYSGPRTVPVKLEISAIGMYPDGRPGGLLVKRALENKLFQPQTQIWHNLGLWVMNGKAVPTGSTP